VRHLPRRRLAAARDPARAAARGEDALSRPRVVLLRGHSANPWDLRPWELLRDEYDVRVLVTGSNTFDVSGLGLPVERVRAVRDLLPRGRAGDLATLAAGDRYLGLEEHLRGADVVHAAEIGVPYSHGPAVLRGRLGFKLVLTVWETIPFGDAYRRFRGRRYRAETLPQVDLFLAATERARRALLLEGAAPERVEVAPPRASHGRSRRRITSSSRPGASCGRRATRTCCALWRCSAGGARSCAR
jgi:hypothetical protein